MRPHTALTTFDPVHCVHLGGHRFFPGKKALLLNGRHNGWSKKWVLKLRNISVTLSPITPPPSVAAILFTCWSQIHIHSFSLLSIRQGFSHTSYLSFFYTGKIFGEQNLHRNLHSKLPIFRVRSVKIYTGQKNLHWRRRPRRRQLSGMLSLEKV